MIVRIGRAGLLLLMVGCAQESASDPLGVSVVVDTTDGVITVANSGNAPLWDLVLSTTIGPQSLLEDGSPEEFGRVVSADLTPDGELYVADAISREVRVFGMDGVHRRTFGREGEGPGEFGSLYSVAWVGGHLLALDPGVGRIGEFGASGEWLGQRSAPGRITGSPAQLRLYPVGPDKAYAFSISAGETGIRRSYIEHTSRGASDTILAIDSSPSGLVMCEHSGGFISSFTVPYGARLAQHPASGGQLAVAWTEAYRIAFVGPNGDTVRVVTRELPSEGVSDEEWEAGLEEFQTFLSETPSASCDPRRPQKPDRKPFIEDILVDREGRLWVEVVRGDGNVWEVFDASGRLVARLPTRERKERAAPAFTSDHVVLIRQDSLDLDHVDIYRINRAPGRGSS